MSSRLYCAFARTTDSRHSWAADPSLGASPTSPMGSLAISPASGSGLRRPEMPAKPNRSQSAQWWPPTAQIATPVSYTHLRAHETVLDLVCRLLLEKKKK